MVQDIMEDLEEEEVLLVGREVMVGVVEVDMV